MYYKDANVMNKRGYMHKLAKWLTKSPALVVLIGTLLLIPSVWGAIVTKVNYDVLSYLPPDEESVVGENILEDHFKSAATTFLMIDNMSEYQIDKIKDEILEIPSVHDVTSAHDMFGIGVPKDFLPKEVAEQFYSDKDGQLLMIRYEGKAAAEETMDAIGRVNEIMEHKASISGLSVFLRDVKYLVLSEMPKYVLLAGFLSLVVLLACIESWVLPFIFMGTLGYGIIYNFGTNIFLGEISYITQAIAAILQLAVTTDYAIFIVHRYEEEKEVTDDRNEAMATAMVQGFRSISGSSLTTIAGFGALCFMNFSIGLDLGIVMMKGVALGVFTCVTILPAFILMFDKQIHKYTHRTLIPEFDGLTDKILKHKKMAALFFVIMFFPAFYWQANTGIYYNINKALPATIQANEGLDKLKQEYGMETNHIIIMDEKIPAHTMKQFAEDIEQLDGVKSVVSLDKILGPGIPVSFLPDSISETFKKDGLQMIMVNSTLPVATKLVNEQVDEIDKLAKAIDPNAKITGEPALTKDLEVTVNRDIKVTNVISILAIYIIIALVFKSLIMPALLVSCIELAIFINMGIPFLNGVSVPFVTPIIIGAIQLGATVDYSILMSTRYQEELLAGYDKDVAIRRAISTSAKSIITSMSVFVAATLGVVGISTMEIIRGLCVMLARGAFISGMIIMFILPPILLLMTPFIDKSKKKSKVKGNEVQNEAFNI